MNVQVIVALICGIAFLVAIMVLAVKFPHPTPFQYNVFRVVLSLAAAAFIAMVPGFIDLKLSPSAMLTIQAGGAIAVFVMVFFFNPAQLVVPPPGGGQNGSASDHPAVEPSTKTDAPSGDPPQQKPGPSASTKDTTSDLEASGIAIESARRLQRAMREVMDRSFQPAKLDRRVTILRPDATFTVYETLTNVSTTAQFELTRVIDLDAPADFKDLRLEANVTVGNDHIPATVTGTPSNGGRTFKVRVDFSSRPVAPGGSMVFEGRCRFPGSVARNRDYWVFPALHERPVERQTSEIVFPKEPVEYAFFKVTANGIERIALPPPVRKTGTDGVDTYVFTHMSEKTNEMYLMTWKLDLD